MSKTVVKLSGTLAHKTLNGLSQKTRSDIAALLNARLADSADLYIQTKLSHWNVRGPTFIALHELFDKAANEAQDYADTLAERAGQLGGSIGNNIQGIAKTSTLTPYNTSLSKGPDVTKAIAQAWAKYANTLRDDIETADTKGDKITADILTRITGEADKMLWFIESHLQ